MKFFRRYSGGTDLFFLPDMQMFPQFAQHAAVPAPFHGGESRQHSLLRGLDLLHETGSLRLQFLGHMAQSVRDILPAQAAQPI